MVLKQFPVSTCSQLELLPSTATLCLLCLRNTDIQSNICPVIL